MAQEQIPLWLNVLVLLLSLVAAVLAWAAKIVWSTEFRKAKEAQIDALKSQLEALRDLTPMKLREYVVATRRIYEEKIQELEEKLRSLNTTGQDEMEIQDRDERLRIIQKMMENLGYSLETVKEMEMVMERNRKEQGFVLAYPGVNLETDGEPEEYRRCGHTKTPEGGGRNNDVD